MKSGKSTNRQVIGITLVLLCSALASCKSATQPSLDQAFVDQLAQGLQVQYQVNNNKEVDKCSEEGLSECFTSSLSFQFAQHTPHDGWAIYFSHLNPIQPFDTQDAQIEHINGDLHRLTFKRDFSAQESITLDIVGRYWAASRSDIVPNMYIQADAQEPRIVESTRAIEDPNTGVNYAAHAGHWNTEAQYRRKVEDELPIADATWNFEYHNSFKLADNKPKTTAQFPRVIPNLKSADWSDRYLSVANGLNIRALRNKNLQAALKELTHAGVSFDDQGVEVRWQMVETPAEHYAISVSSDKITIRSSSLEAVGYALLTLAQLYDTNRQTFPLGQIEDGPTYAYRGMHIDIARNYNGKQSLLNLLDEMYYSKLNKLHLHFADDEGWRVEISDFPSLTKMGAFRCADTSVCLMPQLGSGPVKTASVNGFLTQYDYIELLQYAAARNIEVIPSFDIPGHARAAVQAMEKRFSETGSDEFRLIDPLDNTEYSSIQYYSDNTLNPCLESSYQFVDVVVSRLQKMHELAGTPLKVFHMGADETAGAWVNSPVCSKKLGRELSLDDVHDLTAIFVKRVYALTKERGLTLAGWSDGMGTIDADKRSDNMLVTVWTTLAANGDKVAHDWNKSPAQSVYSFPDVLYFDFPYQSHPHEPGYYWASKNTDLFKVFQFTPQVLSVHQWLWTDRMGHPYSAGNTLHANRPEGIQGQVWSEVIRSPKTLEYMLYPRLYALGEKAWSTPKWQSTAEHVVLNAGEKANLLLQQQKQAWHEFVGQITNHHLPRLADKNINFRLPPPGLNLQGGKIEFSTFYPGLEVEAKVNGQWQVYTDALDVSQSTEFRSRLPGTESTSRSVCIERCAVQQ